ncbi:cation:proton antiporter [Eubacterium multiforme]|uniref:Kef-type K+ transport system membrane component KefB n=1 Tax=Eubacterium multiforme TaxID=83339 RepID=A0ABT9UPK2_9FIRM|nr:cation:proton antiporter [Eubacterium multiforme]MDQ0148584.1 Kef-type K+ transport system membrane component KefB [Eubacterium multiforme]
MLSYKYLLDIAIILLSTKIFGLISRKFKMPQVVGALLAGVILGPALLDILHETDFIHKMAELGVIVLMFTAGLEADIKELKKTGKAAFVIAILGVIIPLIGGFAVAYLYNSNNSVIDNKQLLQNIFIGVIITATSVSITVETLKELGKLNSKSGNTILGAALIDDILGVILLTLITSVADSSISLSTVSLKIIAFFIFSGIVGVIFNKLFKLWFSKYDKDLRRFIIVAFALCLILSYVAEEFFGVADITGAFIAGLIISNTEKTKYINSRFETLSYMILSPIFFASIGIKVEIGDMTINMIVFTIILLVISILSKILGCSIGAKFFKYTNREALQIGTGMISRGEVALIVANKGMAVGLLSSAFLTPIVIVVVITTVITPVLLEFVYAKNKNLETVS